MKNLKTLIIGFAAGTAFMFTTSAIAANTNVTAVLTPDIFFRVNGEVVAPPSDQPVLNYNDRVYVPVRFAATLTGASVDWDVAGRKVIIEKPVTQVVEKEVIKEVEKIVYVDSSLDPDNPKAVYSSIPITKNTSDYKLQITGISRNTSNNVTKIFVSLENYATEKIQLDQNSSKLVVDGKEYSLSKIRAQWDNSWYNDIEPDKENEGWLTFDLIPEDWSKANLTVSFSENISGGKKTTNTFNFKKN